MPHQIEAVKFCRERKYAGIFYEYGTGKTLIALKLIDVVHMSRILVVSTKTAILSTWPDEIRNHTNFQFLVLVGSKQQKEFILQRGLRASSIQAGQYHEGYNVPTIFLINFDGLKNIFNNIKAANFDAIFIDESTKIKSPFTKRTKVLWALGQLIPRRYIMTGFPVTEALNELILKLNFLIKVKLLIILIMLFLMYVL